MKDPLKQADEGAADVGLGSDAIDHRMADALCGSSSSAELRRQWQNEATDESSDLLSRLNALDFVQQTIGGPGELPDRIGAYEIKGLLGRGGMGIVYLGWQEDLEREVALKVLSHNYTADPTMRKRFRAEARATAALHHRHIVPIYDYGESQGLLFFAMERVNGLSLDKHIASARRAKKKPMAFLDAARRFAGVADALGLAHRRRLLHRDVKPGNILVADDDTLALTDFGLAKALDRASMQLTSQGGGFLGTLHYASPEQALGRELTPASDLYSLGVTMFEVVTGHLPLAGKTAEALLQSILHGTPSRLREFAPKPPRDLEAVLEKLLAREPDERYQDGEVLARDLLRIADGEPVHIRRLPIYVRVWRRARKNPVLSGALAAVFVLVLATLTLINVLSSERGRARVSRHQGFLELIAQQIGQEHGPAWGPAPLLQSLTGIEVDSIEPSQNILISLKSAQVDLPEDPQAQDMRRAYVEDAMPNATAYLRAGRGYEALQLYDTAIAETLAGRNSSDHAVKISLYHLYLSRGVAKLTASVSRANDARTDLVLASFLRPGAVFPAALLDVIDVVQSVDIQSSVERLHQEITGAAPQRMRLVGLLLWAAAGHKPHVNSNLMSFSLDYGRRRLIHGLAVKLLGEELGGAAQHGEPSGLAVQFSNACSEALGSLATPAVLRELANQRGSDIRMSVHPESELQGWRYLLQLLIQPRQRAALFDEQERSVSSLMELAAWRRFVTLRPSSVLVSLWLEKFDGFHGNHPGLPGIVEVAARMHLLAESRGAGPWADRWVIEAGGDPAALLCRMQVMLRLGRIQEATDDAMVAVQNSLDRRATLEQVVALVTEAAKNAGPAAAEGMDAIAMQFREILTAAVSRSEGGR